MKFNEEQFEAWQAKIDKERREAMENLPPEELQKHFVVEECVRKLKDAGIPFWLFPNLKINDPEHGIIDTCFQFNNFYDFNEKVEAVTRYFKLLFHAISFTFCRNDEATIGFLENIMYYRNKK